VKIRLDKTGKKFNTDWIFRDLTCTFESDNAYAILGRNGSGKSTLLQVIAGNIHPTSGTIRYSDNAEEIVTADVFHHLSIVAPYQELIEEFTLPEMLKFHFSFKQPIAGYTIADMKKMLNLGNVDHKQIRQFSSGMKQRVKLILAMLSNTRILLLDEPTSNLDQSGTEWFMDLIRQFTAGRIVVVCSNLEQQETGFCREKIHIEQHK
jgi:ABC-type multidrug transport system ATPase subunit